MSKLLFTPTKPCGCLPLEGIIYPSIKSGTIINPPYFYLKTTHFMGEERGALKKLKIPNLYIYREREREREAS
jgi:hypothetical protein